MIRSKKLKRAAETFTEAMHQRLAQKERRGYRGWDKAMPTDDLLAIGIANDLTIMRALDYDEQSARLCVDIANRAMMLHHRITKRQAHS